MNLENLYGKISDAEIGKMVGKAPSTIRRHRTALGIAAFEQPANPERRKRTEIEAERAEREARKHREISNLLRAWR